MKVLALVVGMLFAMNVLLATNVLAGQKFNPHENRWETVPDDSQMRYNPHENDWSYQEPGAQTEYNPHENKWEWNEKPRSYGQDSDGSEW